MRRVKLSFATGVEVDFCDRDRAIKQVEDFAERGTRFPVVVFGPEGCGKTAWLKQATELLRELGFETIYVDPMRKDFIAHTDVKDVVKRFTGAALEAVGVAELKLATLAIDAVKWLIRDWGKRRVAVLVDDVFQAIGIDKAARYVKGLLGLVEYPPEGYERIVVIASTSEGFSRREIGRHRWAEIMPMWNMCEKGFRELYEEIPNPKPEFEDVWRLTGGNPDMLLKLYEAEWSVNRVITKLIGGKEITSSFIWKWKSWLEEAVNDPDYLWKADVPEELVKELIARNLIVYNVYDREGWLWIDEPPPERDVELGIGKYVAWQTPILREAVKKAITQC